MKHQTASQLGLEPGGLGRHDFPRVRNRHHLLDARWKDAKRNLVLAGAHQSFQRLGPPNPAYEVDAFVEPWIANPQQRPQHVLLQNRDVQDSRIGSFDGTRSHRKSVPGATQEHPKLVGRLWAWARRPGNHEIGAQPLQKLYWRKTVKILHHTVVAENLRLAVRENHR